MPKTKNIEMKIKKSSMLKEKNITKKIENTF